MAYNRDDTRGRFGRDRYQGREPYGRDDRWRGERDYDRHDRDERGFFDRAGDEIASWFGDEDAERRRRRDYRDDRAYGRDHDYGDRYGERDRDRYVTSRYRPERSEGFFAASGIRGDYDWSDRSHRSHREDREPRGFGGSRDFDPHYRSWRNRQIDSLDRDYDEYRRENQSRFENDFGSWRERRMGKRSMLGGIQDHMEVVGSDNKHVGTVDRIAGDRIILTKSDEDAGGVHHSLSCSDIDKIEKDKVVLECSAEQAKKNWRDESRSRALFEREDQGESGPRILDRSFEGTYR